MVIDTSQIDWKRDTEQSLRQPSRKIPLTSVKIPWIFIKILAGFPSYSLVIPGIFQTRISGKQANLRKVNRNIQTYRSPLEAKDVYFTIWTFNSISQYSSGLGGKHNRISH